MIDLEHLCKEVNSLAREVGAFIKLQKITIDDIDILLLAIKILHYPYHCHEKYNSIGQVKLQLKARQSLC